MNIRYINIIKGSRRLLIKTRRLGETEKKEVLKLGRWEVWIKMEARFGYAIYF